jgi:hypothetical protein
MKTAFGFILASLVLLSIGWVTVVPNSGTSSGGGLPGDGKSIGTNASTQLTLTNSVATLTDAATVTINASGATNEFVVTLGGNRTIAIPTGGWNGETRILEFDQDATGNRTITLASASGGLSWDVPTTIDPTGANALTLSTNASVADRCIIEFRGTNWSVTDFKRGFRKRS